MTVNSTHGFFLTHTQRSCLNLNIIYILNVLAMYNNLLNPLQSNKDSYLLGGLALTRCDEFPSTPVPCLVTTVPPFSFHPFHLFSTPQPTLHYLQRRHQQSRSSSSRTKRVSMEVDFWNSAEDK